MRSLTITPSRRWCRLPVNHIPVCGWLVRKRGEGVVGCCCSRTLLVDTVQCLSGLLGRGGGGGGRVAASHLSVVLGDLPWWWYKSTDPARQRLVELRKVESAAVRRGIVFYSWSFRQLLESRLYWLCRWQKVVEIMRKIDTWNQNILAILSSIET